MADQIPNAVSHDELASLLQGRTALPSVEFSPDHGCELGLLLALLVHRSEGRGPTKPHLTHALMCLTLTLQNALVAQTSHLVGEIKGPDDALLPILLTGMITALKQIEMLTQELMEGMHHLGEACFDGTVSDAFLASIGVSREEYEDFKKRSIQR